MKFADTFKSGISRKGAIMVAVPLAFEMLFLSVLMLQLDQTDKQRHLAEHGRAIREQGDLLIEMISDAAASLLPYAGNPKSAEGQHYPQVVQRLPAELDKLIGMAQNEAESRELQALKPSLTKAIRLLQELEKSIGETDNELTALMRLKERRHETFQLVFKMRGELNHLFAPVTAEGGGAQKLEEEGVERTKLFIFIGFFASILVALLVAYFFSKEIVDRLKTISDNSIKISLNEPLNPPVGGDDEITGLDQRLRLMAASLQEARRKESAILDNALDVICSIDKTNRVTSINPACLAVWGYDSHELLGKNVLELVAEQDREPLRKALAGRDNAPAVSFEVAIITNLGLPKEMRWSANYSQDQDSWFCVVHDISAAKEVERLKQQFVAMVSHDLRTPLNSLLNLLTLLSEDTYGKLNETGHKRVEAVEREIERLIKLINELLDLEKLEAGQDSLERKSVAVSAIVDASISAILGFAAAHKVQLVNDCRSKATVLVDRDRLTQVFVNLLSNAVKFSPEESLVMLCCEDLNDSRGRALVRISVKDYGCGIAEDKLVSIFERFNQADNAQKSQGTGLGLAIARAIVEQHNGKIGVDSKIGKGSVFWVELESAGGKNESGH